MCNVAVGTSALGGCKEGAARSTLASTATQASDRYGSASPGENLLRRKQKEKQTRSAATARFQSGLSYVLPIGFARRSRMLLSISVRRVEMEAGNMQAASIMNYQHSSRNRPLWCSPTLNISSTALGNPGTKLWRSWNGRPGAGRLGGFEAFRTSSKHGNPSNL